MNLEETTVQYCVDAYEGGLMAVVSNGRLIGFEKEETTTQTANQSMDE